MSILVDRLARIVLVLAPLGLLAGCQGAGSSYPLFSIPGVTRVPPPGSWEHNGDAKYYPDLTPATSGPVEHESTERLQGAASLKWLPHQGQPASENAVVPATFEQPGEYLIRVRADNFGRVDSSDGNQCCWTNGYVKITVTS